MEVMEKEIKRMILKCWYGKDWHVGKIVDEVFVKLKAEITMDYVQKVIDQVEEIL